MNKLELVKIYGEYQIWIRYDFASNVEKKEKLWDKRPVSKKRDYMWLLQGCHGSWKSWKVPELGKLFQALESPWIWVAVLEIPEEKNFKNK